MNNSKFTIFSDSVCLRRREHHPILWLVAKNSAGAPGWCVECPAVNRGVPLPSWNGHWVAAPGLDKIPNFSLYINITILKTGPSKNQFQ